MEVRYFFIFNDTINKNSDIMENKILTTFILAFTLLISSCQSQVIPEFDQDNAFNFLKQQCEFGARVPGTENHKKCKDYLIETLRKYADRVTQQPFQTRIKPDEKLITCYNIIGNFYLENSKRLLLCAHWDTRPWADQDPNPANHNTPVIGANDGASGVAVLLEIARIIHILKPKYGVDIVFFDAEDFGSYGKNESWAQGSKHFAKTLSRNYHPEFGILLDLIGDSDQQLYIERNSYQYAQEIVDRVWNKADEMGIIEFIPEIKHDVYDDHLNLLQAGIQCIDIIDFDYTYWHTTNDTPDKCSPQSLGNVGRVLVELLYN